ncbi:MAG: peptidyl-prolyl cis-trans isomerase D [Gammaproteobacteria bacterium]|jgi:peptidyl-prolyl cis-trans isomerase D
MLQAIRDKTTGWIAYLIVFLICIPFALWGVNSYLGGGEAIPPATVDGQTISKQNFDTAYANYRRQLERAFGGSIPDYLASESILKQQVLTQLIEQSALSQYVNKKYFRIGDVELNKLIRSIEAFNTDGKFDPSIYQSQVASLGYSTASFEQEFRRSQSIEQLQTGLVSTAFTVASIKKKLTSLENQTRKVRVLTRPAQNEKIEIGQADIEDYYEHNKPHFMTTEQLRIDYIELSLDGIKSSIEVTDEQLLDRYEQSKSSFSTPEYRAASHILLTIDADASDEDSDAIRLKLIGLRDKIIQGGNFSDAAKQSSEDPGSAPSGGSLGEIERGMMVKPFEDALFELAVGDLSEPVKTSFGWHLIQLDEVSGGETKSFDSVKSELVDEIRTETAESNIFDLSEGLANLAYEQSNSLVPASEALGLQLQTSDWFDISSGEGIASESKIRSIAFSDDVFRQGLNSEAIELSDNRVVFLRLNEHKPAAQKGIDEVSEQIDVIIRQRKGREESKEVGKQALAALSSGRSLDDIAGDWSASIVDSGFIARDTSELDIELERLAFAMDKPDSVEQYEGMSHPDGRYSIVELSAVLANDSDQDVDKVKALTASKAAAEYQAVLKLLASRAEVVRTSLDDLQ